MNRLFKYQIMQIREAFRCFFKGLLVMAVLFAVLAGTLAASAHLQEKDRAGSLVNVAVTAGEDDTVMNYLITFAGNMSSLKSFCSLKSVGRDEAEDMLISGEADIVIDIPDDFYARASAMQDVSLRVYVPEGSYTASDKLLSLLDSAETMMITTEAAINTMYGVMDVYDISMSRAEMEDALFGDIVEQFMNRDQLFEVKSSSPFGEYDFVSFYMISIIQTAAVLFGVFFAAMYSEEMISLEKLLARGIRERIGMSLVRIVSMAVPAALGTCLITSLYNCVCRAAGAEDRCTLGTAYLWLVLYALCVSALIHLGLSITADSRHTGTIYVLGALILLAVSGITVPAVFLPKYLRAAAAYNPLSLWQGMLLKNFWGAESAAVDPAGIFVTIVIIAAAAVLLHCRRLERS